jgi:hypothetical protein
MFAKRLMLPVSNDTLLRVVRRRSRPPSDPLRVVGAGSSHYCRIESRRPPKRGLPTIRQ